jgi:aminomethyltransferase
MDGSTTPVEASLGWALSKARRAGGARAGGYPGAELIQRQLEQGVGRKRVGLLLKDRMPAREGAELVDADGKPVGKITSGGFGPTVGGPVALGYVDSAHAQVGTQLQAVVRGKSVPIEVVKTPFTPARYFRG